MSDPKQQDPRRGGDEEPPQRQPQRTPPPFAGRNMMGWLVLALLGLFFFFVMAKTTGQAVEVDFDKFLQYAVGNHFKGAVTIEDSQFVGELEKDTPGLPEKATPPYRVYVRVSNHTKEQRFKTLVEKKHELVKVTEDPGSVPWISILVSWAPFLIIAFLVYFFFFRAIRNAGGGGGMLGSFGRSRHKLINKEHSTVTLNDVAGIDEAKDEVGEIIEFLKNPKKFQRLGGRVPRGVLLVGSPGCGKTLLAKAVAGEAEVPFYSISGSDFVEMFVGVGASRVRDLFKQAKDSSPCIIFLDEIDAVGRRRGSGFSSGGHDEREQTLNAILVEMDGFDTSDQVIVMAATNRVDILDPALTRPGRFDRQIAVPLPDVRGRYEILKVHAKRVKMGPDVELERLARGTPMFSGADLAAIINEAAIGATLQNKDYVEQVDLEEARDKVKFGRARKSQKIEEEERIATAYHEAGHAVAQKLLPYADPLHKVTIIPRGQSLGSTWSLPEKDRYGYGARYLKATMRMLCGGRIAEEKKTGDMGSGAAMDIRMITSYARHMVLEWGMSPKLGFVNLAGVDNRETFIPEKEYSDDTARLVDEEVKRLIDEAYVDAKRLLEENWDKVAAVAEALLRYETLSAEEVDRLMKGEPLGKATVSDLLRAEQDKARPTPKPAPQPELPGHGTLPSPA